jgi:hypothetical protein
MGINYLINFYIIEVIIRASGQIKDANIKETLKKKTFKGKSYFVLYFFVLLTFIGMSCTTISNNNAKFCHKLIAHSKEN